MRKIIALTGPKGSGKDTVAKVIQEMYGDVYDVRTIAFADPIKQKIQHLFDLDPTSVEQYDLFKRSDIKYQLPGHLEHSVPGRHVVREIGMLMREYNVDQFTRYVVSQFVSETKPNTIWIVTDLRFDNEYITLTTHGAKVVKVNRPECHYDGHITERGFDDHLVDKQVMNDGSLDYLKIRVKIVMDQLIKEWKL